MSRFLNHSSRRLLAVAALVTATAVPSVVLATQTTTAVSGTMAFPAAVKWH